MRSRLRPCRTSPSRASACQVGQLRPQFVITAPQTLRKYFFPTGQLHILVNHLFSVVLLAVQNRAQGPILSRESGEVTSLTAKDIHDLVAAAGAPALRAVSDFAVPTSVLHQEHKKQFEDRLLIFHGRFPFTFQYRIACLNRAGSGSRPSGEG
jgi:hypothetical protein